MQNFQKLNAQKFFMLTVAPLHITDANFSRKIGSDMRASLKIVILHVRIRSYVKSHVIQQILKIGKFY
jgi:uncharacterized membrane protein